ncbi:MAG: aspartate--tRNA(Asn) ligase [Thermoplasmata archaeon]|nr:MAG: aspartate--tRNA(Asn) ligase [Thermoplasmata archaeon]KAA0010519.1 MAG: aspartate--tRNA(Asn) ligase [Thermoplasmata archaeon]
MEVYRTHYSKELSDKYDGKEVTVAGWVEDIRNLGSIAFIILRDRQGTLQITTFKKQHREIFEKLINLNRESVISVKGVCKANEKVRNGYEIIPEELQILSESDAPLPLGVVDKVKAEMDTRLDNRFIDLRKSEVRSIFMIRDVLINSARDYLRKNGFVEVHTPKIIASASEGGTNLFRLKYFEKDAFLAQSPQLYKQMLMASGLDRVYEIAWYFRAEEHNTRRHLNESTAVDIEMAFIKDEEDVMSVLEGLVKHICEDIKERCKDELETLNAEIKPPEIPVPRIRYDEALQMLEKEGVELEWGEDFGSEEERVLGEIMKRKGVDFYFITKYPIQAKPFYTMPEGELSKSFDLCCKGVEISSGSQRIHDHNLLVRRIEENGLKPDDFRDYLKAFKYGMPPHGGFGLGIERLLMQLLNLKNVRECILFPRDRTRLRP